MERLCIANHPNPLARGPWIAVSRNQFWEIAGDGLVLAARRISQTDKVPQKPPKSVLDFLTVEPAGFRSTGRALWRLVAGARPRSKSWRHGCLEGDFDAGRLGEAWIDRSTLLVALAALGVGPDEPCRIEAGRIFRPVRIFGPGWRIAMLPLADPQYETATLREMA